MSTVSDWGTSNVLIQSLESQEPSSSDWGTANVLVLDGSKKPSDWGRHNVLVRQEQILEPSDWGTQNVFVNDPSSYANIAAFIDGEWYMANFVVWANGGWNE